MINEGLISIANRYPDGLREDQLQDIDRISFHVSLVHMLGKSLCDLGGGQGFFALGCASMGMKVTIVDDFNDEAHHEYFGPVELYKSYDVKTVKTDVITSPPVFHSESFDVVTSFDSLEHWHHSPKKLFQRVMDWLTPGGTFVLGAPNCVNLRKRITVPFGKGSWSRMEDWYEYPTFRGHVREPSVSDFLYIARDMRLKEVNIIGRNWMAYCYPLPKSLAKLIDLSLRPFPRFCSDLYMIGKKP